jgi:hypothetical protein
MDYKLDPLDLPVFGAAKMARILNVVDDDGELDIRRMFYILEKGFVDADKAGGQWVSTPRRLRDSFALPRQNVAA